MPESPSKARCGFSTASSALSLGRSVSGVAGLPAAVGGRMEVADETTGSRTTLEPCGWRRKEIVWG